MKIENKLKNNEYSSSEKLKEDYEEKDNILKAKRKKEKEQFWSTFFDDFQKNMEMLLQNGNLLKNKKQNLKKKKNFLMHFYSHIKLIVKIIGKNGWSKIYPR